MTLPVSQLTTGPVSRRGARPEPFTLAKSALETNAIGPLDPAGGPGDPLWKPVQISAGCF